NLRQQSHPARPIALKDKFFIAGAGQFAGAALDGAFDVVGRHVLGLSRHDSRTQPRVHVGIAPRLRRHRDFLDETGEDLAALGVKRALLMLDGCPFRMAGHSCTSSLKNLDGADSRNYGSARGGNHRISLDVKRSGEWEL